jgi:hypothetical protein
MQTAIERTTKTAFSCGNHTSLTPVRGIPREWENNEMDTDDGWSKVWAEMSDEELRDRLRHYLFLAATSPLKHAKRIAQLVAEADQRGNAEMVDEAMQWVESHEPSKQK